MVTNKWQVYDIETYPNFFLVDFKRKLTEEHIWFEISPRINQSYELVEYIRNECEMMIGFNNLQFDYPLLHSFLTRLLPANLRGKDIVEGLYKKANELINSEIQYRNINYNPLRPQLDLFKIHHYDNRAKSTSLKLLEFNMRMKNVQDIPIKPGSYLTFSEMDMVTQYCINDVNATDRFLDVSIEEIQLRYQLADIYKINCLNYNNSKIGEEICKKLIQQKLGVEHFGKTKRPFINIGDVIFPYVVFNSVQFTLLLQWLKVQIISETKGVFTNLHLNKLESLEGHYYVDLVKGLQRNLNIIYEGFKYVFGVGGIHGCIAPGVYEADDEYSIEDIDVISFYPWLGIANGVYPEHIGPEFCPVYEGIFWERTKYPKKHPCNLGLKNSLNSVYGKSNSEHSAFYDPKYTMTITINGQLSLCMLAERIVQVIPSVTLLQVNTDGLTVKIKHTDKHLLTEICTKWEAYTKLKLEFAQYQKMIIRDVNNYSALKVTNSTSIDKIKDIKRKGAFGYVVSPSELEWHKNHSMLVVRKALEEYFYFNVLPEEYIPNHIQSEDEIYDFFKRVKVPKRFSVVGRITICTKSYEHQVQMKRRKLPTIKTHTISCIEQTEFPHITRYYVSKEGLSLTKIMPPIKKSPMEREQEVEAGWLSTECNDLQNTNLTTIINNINFDYYIHETKKIISAIEAGVNLDSEEDESLSIE